MIVATIPIVHTGIVFTEAFASIDLGAFPMILSDGIELFNVHSEELDELAIRAFLAGLPQGSDGKPLPKHTRWEDLGERRKERWRRIAAAVLP